jgi:LPS sulfotransferase NodH
VIHIVRRDVIGQSVSFSIAHQTQQWDSRQKGDPNVVPKFNFEKIAKKMESFLLSENSVALLCSIFDLPRLEVTYESLTENPRETMLRIGAFSGVDLSSWRPPEHTISKQANQLNADFVSRFVERAKSDLITKPFRLDKGTKEASTSELC